MHNHLKNLSLQVYILSDIIVVLHLNLTSSSTRHCNCMHQASYQSIEETSFKSNNDDEYPSVNFKQKIFENIDVSILIMNVVNMHSYFGSNLALALKILSS